MTRAETLFEALKDLNELEHRTRRFAEGQNTSDQFRTYVYHACQEEYEGWCSKQQKTTSMLMWMLFGHHTGRSFKDFGDLVPQWIWESVLDQCKANAADNATPTSTKEIQMALINTTPIQTTTFIYGIPLDKITDDQVYEALTKINEELSRLNLIPNRPASMTRRIVELKQAEAAIISAVDALDAEKACTT
jgi:predicted transcriptional regulator